MTDILMIVGGLILLFLGGEALIRGAVSLARKFGLSKLLVSAVVVGFGTSMPEMTVTVGAALKGAPDIAIGNVIGSNIANILLISGLGAILHPLSIAQKAVKRDTVMLLCVSLVLCILAIVGTISFWAGFMMLTVLVVYIFISYQKDKNHSEQIIQNIEQDIEGEAIIAPFRASIFAVLGLVLLILGAYFLVEGAVSVAKGFGISEAVIGLTVVAVGTSLPELATTLVAAYHKHSDVVIGNILGSNIFNILAILGVTAMISPISVAAHFAQLDVWIMLAVAAYLAIYLLRGITIGRFSGIALVVIYCTYTTWLYMTIRI